MARFRTPRVFIGSSAERLSISIAEELQSGLQYVAECTIWTQGVFGPSTNVLDDLVCRARDSDCAIFVLTPDDLVAKRGQVGKAPRDNVVFEVGLFMGTLGRGRVFIVCNRDVRIDLPSDLVGVTVVSYGERTDSNLSAALGPVCAQLKKKIMT
ncbi:DNA-binding protein [Sorangium cellulosum]|uniref:DNA-binding protein n=1 Tax=Sorangium cellulosum TaxID=56 RepID=A0A4P2QF28_SORCE|nr:DNA-binding protein [Sorangium cellulosum]